MVVPWLLNKRQKHEEKPTHNTKKKKNRINTAALGVRNRKTWFPWGRGAVRHVCVPTPRHPEFVLFLSQTHLHFTSPQGEADLGSPASFGFPPSPPGQEGAHTRQQRRFPAGATHPARECPSPRQFRCCLQCNKKLLVGIPFPPHSDKSVVVVPWLFPGC